MSQGHWEKLLSKAQYHLKTAHLFTRTDYTTILPAVRPFLTSPRSLVVNCDVMDHLDIICNRPISQQARMAIYKKLSLGLCPSTSTHCVQPVLRTRG
jgi:hypothetical protein